MEGPVEPTLVTPSWNAGEFKPAAWRALLLGLRCCRSLAQRPSHKGRREQHCKHKHSNQHCDQNPKPQFVALTWLVVHCHMDAAIQIPTFTFQLGA